MWSFAHRNEAVSLLEKKKSCDGVVKAGHLGENFSLDKFPLMQNAIKQLRHIVLDSNDKANIASQE